METGQAELPLRGVRVVEFGHFVAVPAAAQALADLGADVIKVEAPAGDAARFAGWTARHDCGPMFASCNRGKRSVVLDLRRDEDRRHAIELALGADVVLQNARPGVMGRLGLGPEQLLPQAPRLVYGSVSGFGEDGAFRSRPGFDIAAQAESGMMSLNGYAGEDPVRVGFTVVDMMASHALTTGVLAALLGRGVTGRGGRVDVSLIDVAVEALNYPLAEYTMTGRMPVRCGNGQPLMAPAADLFVTSDGKHVMISAYTQEHFARLCECLDQPRLAQDPRFIDNTARVKHRQAMRDELGGAIRRLSSTELCDRLGQAGVVSGLVRDLADLMAAQASLGDLFVDVQAPAGRDDLRLPGLPIRFNRLPRRGGRLPGLGEHTQEVLRELQNGAVSNGAAR